MHRLLCSTMLTLTKLLKVISVFTAFVCWLFMRLGKLRFSANLEEAVRHVSVQTEYLSNLPYMPNLRPALPPG